MPTISNTRPMAGGSAQPDNYTKSLILLASLFFMWGFITVINNTLLPHLRSVFELNYTQTTLIESVWFIGYLAASLPSAFLIERIGYRRALATGLTIMTAGSLGMVLAAALPSYWVTLCSLFTVSCGIALLQVAANPYVAVIGPQATSESRLTLVQAFNTTGDVLAIFFGQQLILARTVGGTSADGTLLTHAQRMADAQATELPYLIVAAVLAVLAVVISRAKLPDLSSSVSKANAAARKKLSLWNHKNLVFGCGAIALCVYAEIAFSSLFINFVSQKEIANITKSNAASYLMFFWGGMVVGRFAGALIMRKIAPEKVLATFALGATACALTAVFVTGPVAMYALMVAGLFVSIMFPTIFALSIRGLGPLTEDGSGLLIMSIAGGALEFVQGMISDHYGLNWGFLITAACCLYVLWFALWGSKPTDALPAETLG